VHQVLGVAAVHDREVRLHPQVACVDAQQPGGHRVEGTAPHPSARERRPAHFCRRTQERIDTAHHLAGCSAGEGEQQDAAGLGAARDEVGDAVGERGGLAGAGAGHDEQRAVAVRGGRALLGVEVGQQRVGEDVVGGLGGRGEGLRCGHGANSCSMRDPASVARFGPRSEQVFVAR